MNKRTKLLVFILSVLFVCSSNASRAHKDFNLPPAKRKYHQISSPDEGYSRIDLTKRVDSSEDFEIDFPSLEWDPSDEYGIAYMETSEDEPLHVPTHFISVDHYLARLSTIKVKMKELTVTLDEIYKENLALAEERFSEYDSHAFFLERFVTNVGQALSQDSSNLEHWIRKDLQLQRCNEPAELTKCAAPGYEMDYLKAYNRSDLSFQAIEVADLSDINTFHKTCFEAWFQKLEGYQKGRQLGVYFIDYDQTVAHFRNMQADIDGILEFCWNVERDLQIHYPLNKEDTTAFSQSWRAVMNPFNFSDDSLAVQLRTLINNYAKACMSQAYAAGVTEYEFKGHLFDMAHIGTHDLPSSYSLATMGGVYNLDKLLVHLSYHFRKRKTLDDFNNKNGLMIQIGQYFSQKYSDVPDIMVLRQAELEAFLKDNESNPAHSIFRATESRYIDMYHYQNKMQKGQLYLESPYNHELSELYEEGQKLDALVELLRSTCLSYKSLPSFKGPIMQFRRALEIYANWGIRADKFIKAHLLDGKMKTGFYR